MKYVIAINGAGIVVLATAFRIMQKKPRLKIKRMKLQLVKELIVLLAKSGVDLQAQKMA